MIFICKASLGKTCKYDSQCFIYKSIGKNHRTLPKCAGGKCVYNLGDFGCSHNTHCYGSNKCNKGMCEGGQAIGHYGSSSSGLKSKKRYKYQNLYRKKNKKKYLRTTYHTIRNAKKRMATLCKREGKKYAGVKSVWPSSGPRSSKRSQNSKYPSAFGINYYCK